MDKATFASYSQLGQRAAFYAKVWDVKTQLFTIPSAQAIWYGMHIDAALVRERELLADGTPPRLPRVMRPSLVAELLHLQLPSGDERPSPGFQHIATQSAAGSQTVAARTNMEVDRLKLLQAAARLFADTSPPEAPVEAISQFSSNADPISQFSDTESPVHSPLQPRSLSVDFYGSPVQECEPVPYRFGVVSPQPSQQQAATSPRPTQEQTSPSDADMLQGVWAVN